MSGLPIRDFGLLIEAAKSISRQIFDTNKKLDSTNDKLQELISLLTPENNTPIDDFMEIPLKIRLMIGTGTLFGKHLPFTAFTEFSTAGKTLLQQTIDSNQSPLITGYKFAYLKAVQPGKSYAFSVSVAPSFTDLDSTHLLNPVGIAHPIEVFLIDTNMLGLAADFFNLLINEIGTNFFSNKNLISQFIGHAKNNSWIANLPINGGQFTITPGNSERIIHFAAHTTNGTEGCVITNFDSTSNTFTIGGY